MDIEEGSYGNAEHHGYGVHHVNDVHHGYRVHHVNYVHHVSDVHIMGEAIIIQVSWTSSELIALYPAAKAIAQYLMGIG